MPSAQHKHTVNETSRIAASNLAQNLNAATLFLSALSLSAWIYLMCFSSKINAAEYVCKSPALQGLRTLSTFDIAGYKLGVNRNVIISVSKKKTVNYDHIKNVAFPHDIESFELSKKFILEQVAQND